MSDEMVEEVAGAIMRAYFNRPIDEQTGINVSVPDQMDLARAAIKAMREPTRAMLWASGGAMSPAKRPTPDRVSSREKHRIRYQAMIDAALGQDAKSSRSLTLDEKNTIKRPNSSLET